MRRVFLFGLAVLVVCSSYPRRALAFGPYPHEQINQMAASLLRWSPLGEWLWLNRMTLRRLGLTPDFDWQRAHLFLPDESLQGRQRIIAPNERASHFLNMDLFFSGGTYSDEGLAAFPRHPYSHSVGVLRRLLNGNRDFARRAAPHLDPRTITPAGLAEQGTLPWRILQLYDLCVLTLIEGNYELALIYLGALGHYIGDAAVPFHLTVQWDGQVAGENGLGVHFAWERKIFEIAAVRTRAFMDPISYQYSNLNATEGLLTRLVPNSITRTVARDKILDEVFKLMGESFALAEPLAKSYAAMRLASPASTEDDKELLAKWMLEKVGDATVWDLALKRVAAATELTARLWLSAYQLAQGVNFQLLDELPEIAFNRAKVIEAYPSPSYLPRRGVIRVDGAHHHGCRRSTIASYLGLAP